MQFPRFKLGLYSTSVLALLGLAERQGTGWRAVRAPLERRPPAEVQARRAVRAGE